MHHGRDIRRTEFVFFLKCLRVFVGEFWGQGTLFGGFAFSAGTRVSPLVSYL